MYYVSLSDMDVGQNDEWLPVHETAHSHRINLLLTWVGGCEKMIRIALLHFKPTQQILLRFPTNQEASFTVGELLLVLVDTKTQGHYTLWWWKQDANHPPTAG